MAGNRVQIRAQHHADADTMGWALTSKRAGVGDRDRQQTSLAETAPQQTKSTQRRDTVPAIPSDPEKHLP